MPTALSDLDEPGARPETVRRARGASVVFADPVALCHDFPQLRAKALSSRVGRELEDGGAEHRALIDEWLLHHAALISESQAGQSVVNTPIPVDERPVPALRPPRYGRSIVVSVPEVAQSLEGRSARLWADQPPGLLDLKGVGLGPGLVPAFGTHRDGLLLLGEALADLSTQWLIHLALEHAGLGHRTLPSYAVLDLGFDAVLKSGRRLPVGLQVRRAHRRNRGGAELPSRQSQTAKDLFTMEMLLRCYGITSCGRISELVFEREGERLHPRYAGGRVTHHTREELDRFCTALGVTEPVVFEGINIQTTRDEGAGFALVDFGHFTARPSFHLPVLSLVHDRPLRYGGALRPGHPRYLQPRPELLVPLEHWGPPTPEEPDPFEGMANDSRVARTHYALAHAVRRGEIDREATLGALWHPVERATERWPRGPSP